MNNAITEYTIADDIISVSADAIISIDEDQLIIRFNKGAEQIFGYQSKEVLGQSLSVLIPHHFREAHEHHVRAFGGEEAVARHMAERKQISGLRKSGEEFPAEASISKTYINGRTIYTATLRDITERIRGEQSQLAEARAAVRARDDMLSVISHDLRNPISTMDFSAALIIDLLSSSPNALEIVPYLDTIRRAAHRAFGLVNNLMDLTRIDTGRLTVAPACHKVFHLLNHIVPGLQIVAQEKRISLECDPVNKKLTVMADEGRIAQVISNLVDNAIKFTPSGGTIRISAHKNDGFAEFAVSDTGPGIPIAEMSKVFDRFWQEEKNSAMGMGLGLFIAKSVVETHGGRIWVESKDGGGCTFRFTLPTVSPNPSTP